MSSVKITNKNLEETIKKNDIVILDFWASWCGPCKMFGPIFDRAATKYPDIAFGKVNTEEEVELSGMFKIRSIPTLMAFREGILIFSQPGALPEDALDDLIGKIKALDMNMVKEEISKQQAKGMQA